MKAVLVSTIAFFAGFAWMGVATVWRYQGRTDHLLVAIAVVTSGTAILGTIKVASERV